jgi:hypothetical protein
VTFAADGRFSSAELPPGRYYLRLTTPPAGWTFKSAMSNGRDVSNVPLSLDRDANGVVLTLTDHPGELVIIPCRAASDPKQVGGRECEPVEDHRLRELRPTGALRQSIPVRLQDEDSARLPTSSELPFDVPSL